MTQTDLHEQHCKSCEGGVEPMDAGEAQEMARRLEADWHVNEAATEIRRDFKFKDFYRTIAFVNAVAWIANREDHHPDLEVGYGHCLVRFSTHAIGGLSENDFICAAKVDALEA